MTDGLLEVHSDVIVPALGKCCMSSAYNGMEDCCVWGDSKHDKENSDMEHT